MRHYKHLFEQLYSDYSRLNPSVKKINELFKSCGETIINDHIALRTFSFSSFNLDSLAKPFLEGGYKVKGFYRFNEKKLTAKHYEHEKDALAPKVFISQLEIEELPKEIQVIIYNEIVNRIKQVPAAHNLIHAGPLWGTPDYNVYLKLLSISEYAAWLYVFGFRANHFTILINHLRHFTDSAMVNKFLKQNGYVLNTIGGEIKGSKETYLEQSSTLADKIEVEFKDRKHLVPCCYYEFAMRHVMPNGKLYTGFNTDSANKIFESTNTNQTD